MTEIEILEKVKQALTEVCIFALDANEIEPTDSLANDLGMDSMDMVSIIIRIEEAFMISIQDVDAESWKTVQDICTYIQKQQQ